jgi:hypothetical protein
MPKLRAMPEPTQTRLGSALRRSFVTPPMNGYARFVARSHVLATYPAEESLRKAVGQRDGPSGYFGLDSVPGWS